MATKKTDEKTSLKTEKGTTPVKKSTTVKQKTDDKPAKTETAKATSTAQKTTQDAKKTSTKKYHIAQRNEDSLWQVKAEGAEKALKLFKTQQEAIDYAKKVAGNQEGSIMIHKKDGSFRKLTY